MRVQKFGYDTIVRHAPLLRSGDHVLKKIHQKLCVDGKIHLVEMRNPGLRMRSSNAERNADWRCGHSRWLASRPH